MSKNKVEAPEQCRVCDSEDLLYLIQQPILNLRTGEQELRNCWVCMDCETLHYFNGSTMVFQFTPGIIKRATNLYNNKMSNVSKG